MSVRLTVGLEYG